MTNFIGIYVRDLENPIVEVCNRINWWYNMVSFFFFCQNKDKIKLELFYNFIKKLRCKPNYLCIIAIAIVGIQVAISILYTHIYKMSNFNAKLTLDEIKSIDLNILSYVTSLCQKHNLRYFLDYGT